MQRLNLTRTMQSEPQVRCIGLVRRLAAWMLRRPRSNDLFFCNLRDTARAIYRATRQKPNADIRHGG